MEAQQQKGEARALFSPLHILARTSRGPWKPTQMKQRPWFSNPIMRCIKNCIFKWEWACSCEAWAPGHRGNGAPSGSGCSPGKPNAGSGSNPHPGLQDLGRNRIQDCCPSCVLLLKWEKWLNFVWAGRWGLQRYTEEVPRWTATLFLLLSDSFSLFLPSPPWCLGLFHMWHKRLFVYTILLCNQHGY